MATIKSCFDPEDKSLNFREAKNRCLSAVDKSLSVQKVAIRTALNRVLSQDIISPINVPNYANSAVDGYAFKKDNLSFNQSFEVISTVYAGMPLTSKNGKTIATNQCLRVMTGALIPEGIDFVVPQEFAVSANGKIRVNNYHGGANIRLAGEDLAKGSIALKKGRLLNPADLGLLASLGVAQVNVWRKLRVAFFSTGDELRALGTKITSGQVYDSNRYSLYGLLNNLGVDVLDMGVVKDNPQQLNSTLTQASKSADVIITTGGVSVGEADFIKQVLRDIGSINFWQLAIKPGRPLTFGTIKESYFFGLPGNPVATMITFYQIVQPFLNKMMGKNHIEPLLVNATSTSNIHKSAGRREFLRAVLSSDNGQLSVKKLDKQGSGVLSSMSKANCLIVLAEQTSTVKIGDIVQVQLFYGLI